MKFFFWWYSLLSVFMFFCTFIVYFNEDDWVWAGPAALFYIFLREAEDHLSD